MPRATLQVRFPPDVWVGELTRKHTDVQFRILAATPRADAGVALVEITGDGAATVADAMAEYDEVTSLEVLEEQSGYVLVQFETVLPLLLEAAQEAGVPISLPLTLQSGRGSWEITASRDRLAQLGSALELFGLTFSVESIYQEVGVDQLLTDDQWDLLETAIEMGYYDTPRSCTQYELAETVGVARSTCSEMLHRAESEIITRFVAEERPPVS